MHIARHEVDLQLAQRLVSVTQREVNRSLDFIAEGDVNELSEMRSIAIAGAAVRCVTGAPGAEVRAMLRTASRAGGALWALADHPDVEIGLDASERSLRIVGRVHESYLSSPTWLKCFFLAILDDDRPSQQTVCKVSTDLRASSTRTDEHNHLFAEAMRKYASGDPDAAAVAKQALALAVSGPHMLSADWVRAIDRPMIEVAVHVLSRDSAGTDRALVHAFEAHRTYWGVASRANRDTHWISVDLAALLVMGQRAGLNLTTTSDYAPPELIKR